MSTDGLLLVDKPPGCTSHDVVRRVRKLFRQKRVGHCGTLDPDATGLLLLPLGQATRLSRFLMHAPKVYEGVIRFGVATDTYDASGRIVSEASAETLAGLAPAAVEAAMTRFVGTFEQDLPAYSARKVGGVKLYELARRGEEVPEAHKEVTVYELAALAPLGDARQPFRLACSSGTYARSIAHDLGVALGCGAHLAALRRTATGPFRVEDALGLDELGRRRAAGEPLGAAWSPLAEIPLPFADGAADAQQERRVRHGQTALLSGLGAAEGDWVRLVNRRGELIAIGTVAERIGAGGLAAVRPRIVFSAGPDVVGFSRT